MRPVLLALAIATAPAPGAASEDRRPWYVPDAVVTQLAGHVGFVSPGFGYALGRAFEADVFLGWVPEAIGGEDIFSTTGKLTFVPWRLDAGRDWRVRPLRLSVQLSYTFGSQYFVLSPGRHHPTGYYHLPTALHGGVGLGAEVARRLDGTRSVALYAETVALDWMLNAWLQNRREIDLDDVFSLAVGAKLRL